MSNQLSFNFEEPAIPSDERLRREIANDEKTPIETLKKLLYDDKWFVRSAANKTLKLIANTNNPESKTAKNILDEEMRLWRKRHNEYNK